MEIFIGVMGNNIRVNGKMGNRRELESISMRKGNAGKGCGKMGKEFSGLNDYNLQVLNGR